MVKTKKEIDKIDKINYHRIQQNLNFEIFLVKKVMFRISEEKRNIFMILEQNNMYV